MYEARPVPPLARLTPLDRISSVSAMVADAVSSAVRATFAPARADTERNADTSRRSVNAAKVPPTIASTSPPTLTPACAAARVADRPA